MSKSDDLRKRIESLNRKQLSSERGDTDGLRSRLRKSQQAKKPKPVGAASGAPNAPANEAEAERTVRYSALPAATKPPHREPLLFGADEIVTLEKEMKGAERGSPSGQKAFVVERRPSGPYEEFADLDRTLREALARGDTRLSEELARLDAAGGPAAEDIAFFDLETTGLGSSPLFLIGAMVCDGDGLVVRQYFARDYTEERAVLEMFLALCDGKKLLVSFNGKSFDVPFVRMRCAYNGLPCTLEQSHLDLLHTARRVWKGRTPDCKLQTLERLVCGRRREGDIPGSMIPDAYHDYVRTKNAVRMVDVLKHNYLDLITLAELLVCMGALGA
jgi:uncharacterized protein YprB with RNaseH-like and TPR domain